MNRSLSRALLLLGATFALSGPALAKKKKAKKSTAEAKAPAAAKPDVPDDANSRKYAEKLLEANITDFSPSDGAGAKFEYSTLSFAGDNTWSADAYVEIADERMECVEGGKWSMEPAESATQATVSWTVDATDCPGRESGSEIRAVLNITKSGVDAIFR